MNPHPYEWLKSELREAFAESNFRQRGEQRDPDHFGSAFIVFVNERWEFRLVWDGKEGWGLLQRRRAGSQADWEDAAEPLSEGDLEGASVDMNKVQRWRQAVKACRA